MMQEQKSRRENIVEAYRHLGNMSMVAENFGVSRQYVQQIISNYEKVFGEQLPRFGKQNRRVQNRKYPVEWRCAGCGEVRRNPKLWANNQVHCQKCTGIAARKYLSDDVIIETINSIINHCSWEHMAKKAGYKHTSQTLQKGVYRYLLRRGDYATISRLWPRGVSKSTQDGISKKLILKAQQ